MRQLTYQEHQIHHCSCLMAPLCAYMNRHCDESDTPSRHWFVIKQFYSMWLLTHSHNMINHGFRALVHGQCFWFCFNQLLCFLFFL